MSAKSILLNNRIKLSQFFAAMLLILILFSTSIWEDKSLIIGDVLYLVGAILVGIATVGRLWCSLYLSGYKDNTLIMSGPYSISRNPLYFFSFLGSVGLGLATETIIVPLIVLIGFSLYYPYVIREEEKRLHNIHGTSYETYCQETPKFFPVFSHFAEPESYVVKPKIFRKRVFDSLWFVWILGILELFEAFHEYSVIPIFVKLY
jgi:protein-S-isoprenylcysteine O-methyltransferase Ste14